MVLLPSECNGWMNEHLLQNDFVKLELRSGNKIIYLIIIAANIDLHLSIYQLNINAHNMWSIKIKFFYDILFTQNEFVRRPK